MTEVVAGVLGAEGRYLCAKRKDDGLWEFPGGKLEAGEDARSALVRELREELSIEVEAGNVLAELREGEIRLIFVGYRLKSGVPTPLVHAELRWMDEASLREEAFLPLDRDFIDRSILSRT